MPLLVLGGVDIHPHPLLEEAAQPLEDPPVEIPVVLVIEDLVEARDPDGQADRTVRVAAQVLHEAVELAVLRDEHVAAERPEHVHAVEEILQVELAPAHQVFHGDLVEDFGLLAVEFVLHQEHRVTAFDHVPVDIGDRAEASPLHEEGLVVEEISRLDHLPVAAEEHRLRESLRDEFEAHDPVVDHRKVGSREPDHVDLDTEWVQVVEQ